MPRAKEYYPTYPEQVALRRVEKAYGILSTEEREQIRLQKEIAASGGIMQVIRDRPRIAESLDQIFQRVGK